LAPDKRLAKIFSDQDLNLATTAGHWVHVSKYRYVDSLLSAEGAQHSPGRYHRQGEIPALYFAQSPITALLEVGMLFGGPSEFVVRRGEPHLLVVVELEIPSAVLDMTDEANHKLFKTEYQELTGEWLMSDNPATQRLGKAAYDSKRVVAIRYPSAKWRGEELEPNLVVFRDRLCELRGAVMRAYDPQRDLPRKVKAIGRTPYNRRKR